MSLFCIRYSKFKIEFLNRLLLFTPASGNLAVLCVWGWWRTFSQTRFSPRLEFLVKYDQRNSWIESSTHFTKLTMMKQTNKESTRVFCGVMVHIRPCPPWITQIFPRQQKRHETYKKYLALSSFLFYPTWTAQINNNWGKTEKEMENKSCPLKTFHLWIPFLLSVFIPVSNPHLTFPLFLFPISCSLIPICFLRLTWDQLNSIYFIFHQSHFCFSCFFCWSSSLVFKYTLLDFAY